ncbi:MULTISPECIES: chemotaxis response regulator protein-glutamate methylesterase [unclassified Aureispira]|uniref:protein-glutamate methylesterase/protein-glutamine glutaminase n=1 Tax=unclassified Aureispira TaxID=2649989 RepID=UPI00069818FD|nr:MULTISPECIES: chemotaxis response regulator protein-glutamate methylesterase [unclassified Aureispira]WMX13453.1 chemotaxis response regulator protein-glutamate methylesterase [Aureispira sp. CCB-E]
MNEKKQIRVLVADDSALMRILINDIINTDPDIHVIGQANNGKTAYLLTQKLKPDVVLMDVNMGEYDGIYGVVEIMEHCPTPIIILSSIGNVDMNPILQGLELGAIDYLNKPAKNRVNMDEVKQDLIEKIKVASTVDLEEVRDEPTPVNIHEHSFDSKASYDCIVLGASTGGPRSLEKILTQLPKNLTIPVVIAQHMPANFVPAFADRLNQLTPLNVRVAEQKEVLEAGNVYLAPGDVNLTVERRGKKYVFGKTEQEFLAYNNPSVDGLMLSVAKAYQERAIGVVLTGMGKDGAIGLKAMKDAGSYTIAQSEASCIVYGMPKAAVQNQAVKQVVHLDEIAAFLVSCLA